MVVAVVKRLTTILLLTGVALTSLGAAPDDQHVAMLETFNDVLTAMVYAASGLAFFSIVWAGFVLMAEGSEERSAGSAKKAVFGAVTGLVLVLSAKGIALALLNGIVPIP